MADTARVAGVGKKIIVGFDGSESARRALDRAADFAGYASSITVVTVSEPGLNGDGRRLLADAKEQLAAQLIHTYALNPVGDPAEELLRAASTSDADMLVIGTQTQGRPHGPIGARLFEQAPCDVLVVR